MQRLATAVVVLERFGERRGRGVVCGSQDPVRPEPQRQCAGELVAVFVEREPCFLAERVTDQRLIASFVIAVFVAEPGKLSDVERIRHFRKFHRCQSSEAVVLKCTRLSLLIRLGQFAPQTVVRGGERGPVIKCRLYNVAELIVGVRGLLSLRAVNRAVFKLPDIAAFDRNSALVVVFGLRPQTHECGTGWCRNIHRGR